jgi:hypothetical protein
MCLALNMARIAKEGFSCAAIEKTQYLIKTPRAVVREVKKQGIQFPGHQKVKTAIQRHPTMRRQNNTSCCLPGEDGTTKNP